MRKTIEHLATVASVMGATYIAYAILPVQHPLEAGLYLVWIGLLLFLASSPHLWGKKS